MLGRVRGSLLLFCSGAGAVEEGVEGLGAFWGGSEAYVGLSGAGLTSPKP